jgi:outer membrane protein assembly factor BamD
MSLLILTGLVLGLWGCSSTEKKADTPESLFKLAEYYEGEERFEEALRRYNDIRQRFPYSNYAIEAELRVADVYFKQGSFAEAQLAYESFREQRPQHEKSDYVIFKLGLSFYHQLPDTNDRDLTLAPQAIEAFDDLIQNFPLSTHLEEAKVKRSEVESKMIDKVKYIADFYFKRKNYLSALERYQSLLGMTNDTEIQHWALTRGAESAKHIGDIERQKEFENLLKSKFSSEDSGGANAKSN